MITCFKNGRVLRDHQLIQEEFWISNGKIIDKQKYKDNEIDAKGHIIAPGYIDLQINGAFGQDFSSKNCQFDLIATKLPRYGVTSFLATIVSSKPEDYPSLLAKNSSQGSQLLGFHLEGPFLNPARKGAHRLEYLRGFLETSSLEQFFGSLDRVRMITLAVELPDAMKHIEALIKRGVVVAVGHTEASFEEICQSRATLVTHLYNAMPPFQGRNPGPIGAGLMQPGLFYSIIADGTHCHAASIKIAIQSKPKEIVLISDAMAALGLDDGNYYLGEMAVTVSQGKAVLTNTETLAGSVIGLDSAVRYLHQVVGCSIVEAIEAASLQPAQVLRIDKHKGTLSVGADADFILLNDNLVVQETYVGGKCQDF